MRKPEPRLQRKLLVLLLVPLLMLLALDAAAAWWTSVRLANLAYDRSLHEIAREIVLHVRVEEGRPRLDLSQGAADVLMGDPQDRLSFRLSSDDGTLLGGDPAIAPARLAPGSAPRYFGGQLHGESVRFVEAWMPASERAPLPRVLIQVAETLNKRNTLAWEMLLSILAPQLLLILIATFIVWFGVSRGLAPLARLRRAVSDRSHLDLSPIATDDVPGEVRPLVDEVNDLMSRLGRTFEFQNRFVADAAHQLKTPVSGLKAQIELALRETDPERLRHGVAQLYVSADRLSRLVRQLLSLARNEPGALDAVQLHPLDLDAFALQVGMDWVPQAIRRGIDLGFEGVRRPMMIAAEPDRLRELINNLIDNAIRYSERDGRVTVRVSEADAGHVQLAISDDGPAIPVVERARVFERFHRLLGTPDDGSGLGLAIASEIATLHKARITLEEDSDGVGNTFSVIFPKA
jgi:two-component system sensor histidine kinase TctE